MLFTIVALLVALFRMTDKVARRSASTSLCLFCNSQPKGRVSLMVCGVHSNYEPRTTSRAKPRLFGGYRRAGRGGGGGAICCLLSVDVVLVNVTLIGHQHVKSAGHTPREFGWSFWRGFSLHRRSNSPFLARVCLHEENPLQNTAESLLFHTQVGAKKHSS